LAMAADVFRTAACSGRCPAANRLHADAAFAIFAFTEPESPLSKRLRN
jgi:hypothetical protein